MDTVGPTVEITAGPTGSILFPEAEFTFGSPEADATFECKLDGNDTTYVPCDFPGGVLAASPRVRTRSPCGRSTSPATGARRRRGRSATTRTPPTRSSPITSGPQRSIGDDEATVEFNVSEPSDVTCTLDDAAARAVRPAVGHDRRPGRRPAHDRDQRRGPRPATTPFPRPIEFTVDTIDPVVEITSGPQPITVDNTPTVVFTVSEPGAAVTCEVDSDGPVPCTSPFDSDILDDGAHIITVRAVDAAGNIGQDSVAFTVQGTPPNTFITAGGTTGTVNTTTATFSFTSSEPNSTFQCQIDANGFGPCTGDGTTTYTGLTPGFHLFRVRAIDSDGNPDPSPAERGFTVDTAAPVVNIGQVPTPTNDNTVAIPFTVDDPTATVVCKVDGNTVPCTPTGFTTAALADGPHSVVVTATDPATNTGQSSVLFTVDTTAPVVTITGGPTGTINVPEATFSFTSEAGAAFQCSLDGGGFVSCTSPRPYTVAAGAHTFSVRAIDSAGNVSAVASRSWTYKNCLIKIVLGITICI